MNEFVINDFLSLRLERRETNIYINGKFVDQCKFLLMHIPLKNVSDYDEIDSIDEASEVLEGELEDYKANIDPEEEFWGHCSNLQVWAEHNYDTRILHRTIAFPLLKRLTEVGDLLAKKVFKDEVVNRFLAGNKSVATFLLKEGYLAHFTPEELDSIFEEFNFENIEWRKNEFFEFLLKLTKLGSEKARQMFKIKIKEDHSVPTDLLNEHYMNIFSAEELDTFFEDLDFDKIKWEDDFEILECLPIFIRSGNAKAQKIFKEKFFHLLLDSNIDSNLLRYLENLNPQYIDEIFENFDFTQVKSDLWVLRDIADYTTKGKEILREEVEKSFLSGNLENIDRILGAEKKYLKEFNESELHSLFACFNTKKLLTLPKYHALRLFKRLLDVYVKYNLNKSELFSLMDALDFKNFALPLIEKLASLELTTKDLFNKEVKSRFLKGNNDDKEYIYEKGYLEEFLKEDMDSIFKELDMQNLDINLLRDIANRGFSIAISAYRNKLIEEKLDSDLKKLKKQIISRFEYVLNRDTYFWLKKLFDKDHRDANLYTTEARRPTFHYLIDEDFEEIFANLRKNQRFCEAFLSALEDQEDQEIEISFTFAYRLITMFCDKGIDEAIKLFNKLAIHSFNFGRLKHISFLGRPEYLKYVDQTKQNSVFTLLNKNILKEIQTAINFKRNLPEALVTLKRMQQNGDGAAERLLFEYVSELSKTGNEAIKNHINEEYSAYLDEKDN